MATTTRKPKRCKVQHHHYDQGEGISLSLPHHLQTATPDPEPAYGHSLHDYAPSHNPTAMSTASLMDETDIPPEIREAGVQMHSLPKTQPSRHSISASTPEEVVPVVETTQAMESTTSFDDQDLKAAFAEDLSSILSRDLSAEAEDAQVIDEVPPTNDAPAPEEATAAETPASQSQSLAQQTPDSIAVANSAAHQQFDRETGHDLAPQGSAQISLANQLSYFDSLMDKEEARQVSTLPAVVPKAATTLSLEHSFKTGFNFSEFPLKFHTDLFPNTRTV